LVTIPTRGSFFPGQDGSSKSSTQPPQQGNAGNGLDEQKTAENEEKQTSYLLKDFGAEVPPVAQGAKQQNQDERRRRTNKKLKDPSNPDHEIGRDMRSESGGFERLDP
jgi:hypothetical protein